MSTTPIPKASQTSRRIIALWVLAIVLASVVPYLPSLQGGFVLDDDALIVEDPLIHSLSNLPKAFQTDFLHGNLGAEVAFYYRPLITASFQIDYAIAGLNPLYFRVVNLLLNLAIVFLVFSLARHATRNITAAGIAALAFATLPSHAESVAWISGRTDLISTLFILASVLVFAKSQDSHAGFRWPMAALCSLFFLCALLSKESGAAVPLLMLIYAWVLGGPKSRREWLKWGVALVPAMLIYLAMRRLASGTDVEQNMLLMLGERLQGVGIAYVAYFRMLFLPQELRVIYDVFPIGIKYPIIAAAAWVLLLGIVVLAVWAKKRAPVVSFGLLWIVLALLPVTNIVPTIGPLPAERFVYLASVGSSLLIGWAGYRLLQWHPGSLASWSIVAPAIVVSFVLYCSALTVQSTRHYHTTVNWARSIAASGCRFANLRLTGGAHLIKAEFLEEGIKEMEVGLQLLERSKGDLSEYLMLAVAKRDIGDTDGCMDTLDVAQAKLGDSAEIRYHRGVTYAVMNRLPEAVEAFESAVRMQPNLAPAWRNLGKARVKMGLYREAISAYERAFRDLSPSPQDRFDLALAYKRSGQVEKAAEEFSRVIEDDPKGDLAVKAAEQIKGRGTP